MAMNPGMKMMLMQRTSNGGGRASEYGGGRRMIGYDRDSNGQSNMRMGMDNRMEESRNYGGSMGYPHMTAGEDRGYANNYGIIKGPRTDTHINEEVYRGNRGYEQRERSEARRQRDSRGRYMMAMDDDDEDTEMRGQTWYPPTGRMSPSMHGGSSYGFGDVYARINAPGAMNRPGSKGNDMSKPVDEDTAREWVEGMDGGEKFKVQHADQLRNSICPDCDMWEFYVAINAMYSDYHKTAREMGVDKPEYYAMLARDFLCDADAGPHKLRKYMETIPK